MSRRGGDLTSIIQCVDRSQVSAGAGPGLAVLHATAVTALAARSVQTALLQYFSVTPFLRDSRGSRRLQVHVSDI